MKTLNNGFQELGEHIEVLGGWHTQRGALVYPL